MTVKSPETTPVFLSPAKRERLMTGITETALIATRLHNQLWDIAAFEDKVRERLWDLARFHIGVGRFERGIPHPPKVDSALSTSARMLVAQLGDDDHQLILEGGVQGGSMFWERLPVDISVNRTIREDGLIHGTTVWDLAKLDGHRERTIGMMASRYQVDERGYSIRDTEREYITGEDDHSYTEESEAELDLIRDDLKTLESFVDQDNLIPPP